MAAKQDAVRQGQLKIVRPHDEAAAPHAEAQAAPAAREPMPAEAPPAEAPTPEPVRPEAAVPAEAPKRRPLRRLMIGGVALVALALGAWQGYEYWTVGRFFVSTDDAYVGADMASIAPKLSGPVVEVAVAANQRVRAGDVLVRLDPSDYRSAVDQNEAKLATQRATVARIGSQAETADAAILQARAQVQSAEADVQRTRSAYERAQSLARSDFASRATLENALADRDRAAAQRAAADAALGNAEAARRLVDAQKAEAERGLREIEVSIEKARRDLAAATLVAPFDGVVAAKSVQVGDYASPGKRLLSLVPLDRIYIDANFKETQLARITPGEKVDIHVDAYPDRQFEGTVIGLAAGTGSTFSLLPADNATGNFTKIVQRVPVRVAVSQPADGAPLRPGMSVTARVDIRTAPTN